MSELTAERPREGAAKGVLALGVLALVVFIVGGPFAGALWIVGAVLGGLAAIAGFVVSRQAPSTRERRFAVAGALLGAVAAIWFVGYLIVDAVN